MKKCMCETTVILTKYIKKGRAHFVCPECGRDVTMMVCLFYDMEQKSKQLRIEKKFKK